MSLAALIARPIAHRGLHCAARGVIENTRSAIEAAIAEGFNIEVDLRRSQCGMPMVFHDADLDRLTLAQGPVQGRRAAELSRLAFKATSDKMLTLPDLLALVDGRRALLLEIKSDWQGSGRFEAVIAELLRGYRGDVAVMSFDPQSVRAFAEYAPGLPRGLVAEAFHTSPHWEGQSGWRQFAIRHLLTGMIARPHFIAYDIRALPALAPLMARHLCRLPLLTWTVCTKAEQVRAKRYADVAIFERHP